MARTDGAHQGDAPDHEGEALQADLAGYRRERRRQRLGALAYFAIALLAMAYVGGCVAGSLVLLDLLENSAYLANLADRERAELIVEIGFRALLLNGLVVLFVAGLVMDLGIRVKKRVLGELEQEEVVPFLMSWMGEVLKTVRRNTAMLVFAILYHAAGLALLVLLLVDSIVR